MRTGMSTVKNERGVKDEDKREDGELVLGLRD